MELLLDGTAWYIADLYDFVLKMRSSMSFSSRFQVLKLTIFFNVFSFLYWVSICFLQ